jgi:hypothetical protein
VGENFGRNTVIYRIKSFIYRIVFLNTDTDGCPRQIFRKWDCGEAVISIYCLKDIGLTPAQNLLQLGSHIIFIYDLTGCV